MSFDLSVTFGAETYADNDPVSLTVAAADGRTITLDEVRYSATYDDPFTVDGLTATGVARADLGHLLIRVTDSGGSDAATHAPVPMSRPRFRR